MSYTSGYGTPYGEIRYWGNGDGRFLYPPNRNPGLDRAKYLGGPVDSVRWENLREGFEDYEYLWLLERAVSEAPEGRRAQAEAAKQLLDPPPSVFVSGREYTKDPKTILEHRQKVAEALESLGAGR